MKALSIRQPWAEMILAGDKTVEVRGKNTNVRGRVAIHAGKTVDRDACIFYGFEEENLVTGAILGFVDIEGTFPFRTQLLWDLSFNHHKVFYGYGPGLIGYILSNPERLKEPISCRGQLGFFDVLQENFGGE